MAIPPIILCFGLASLFGSGLIFGTGVVYGMMALGKKWVGALVTLENIAVKFRKSKPKPAF